MKTLIANTLVKQFKKIPYLGRHRFWTLYWAYRITGWHIRHKEWDFVLQYLPPLADWQKVSILDVGCSRNLFCHELDSRGYKVTGFDLEPFNGPFPGDFYILDIRDSGSGGMDFVTCISVLEHIETGKDKALENMVNSLKIGGRLLLTIPTEEFAQGHPWKGFTRSSLESLLPGNCVISEYTERAGQICCAIERTG